MKEIILFLCNTDNYCNQYAACNIYLNSANFDLAPVFGALGFPTTGFLYNVERVTEISCVKTD